MATLRQKMNASRALADAGCKVALISELLGAGESTVYEWLEKVPPRDAPSVAQALDEEIASRDDDSLEHTFVALARAFALKLDRMLSPGATATESMALQGSVKEYRSLVDQVLGPSKDDEEWLIQVYAKVGHSPNAGS
jgi:hypothetical protein